MQRPHSGLKLDTSDLRDSDKLKRQKIFCTEPPAWVRNDIIIIRMHTEGIRFAVHLSNLS